MSLGATRQFIFREVSDHGSRWCYHVYNGDCVEMFGDCQVTASCAGRGAAADTSIS